MALPAEEIIIERETRSSGPSITIHTSKCERETGLAIARPFERGSSSVLRRIDLMPQAFNAQLKPLPKDKVSGLVSMLIPQKSVHPTL